MTEILTPRQEKILNTLTREYIKTAKPVSSNFLGKKCRLGICPATIRIELQKLTKMGFIKQPHTSAGRIPTEKGYKFFVENFLLENEDLFFNFVLKEIKKVKRQIEEELKLTEELMKSLEEFSSLLNLNCLPKEKEIVFEVLTKIGPTKTTYYKNVETINSLIKELESC